MKKTDTYNSPIESISLWSGNIALTQLDGLKKGDVLPVRVSGKNKVVVLGKDSKKICSLSSELSQVISTLIKNDIYVGASVLTAQAKKEKILKLNLFVLAERRKS
ncbi:MAG: hypothetical protein HZA77_11880 [Candidatus Schekmanbacteria bacterium]|nr:hypothetical protein [Candidatus Schekmanbacteria bacterium]